MIGGSFALGLKANGYPGEIIGWDREETLQKAKARGAIDRGTPDLGEAMAGADLVYLAAPVVLILDLLPQVARQVRPGTLVTDSGSTKVRICRLAREVLPASVFFLGGHPLAGKETPGIESADAKLFEDAKYVIVRESRGAEPSLAPRDFAGDKPEMTEAEREFLSWVKRLGAEPVELDAETHDWALALVSHLPQLVSTALASTVWDETDEDGLPLSLAASGFQDMTRLAGSPYDVWRDICLTNADNLGRALERLEQTLERLRTHLHSKELAEEFKKAQQTYSVLGQVSGRNKQ